MSHSYGSHLRRGLPAFSLQVLVLSALAGMLYGDQAVYQQTGADLALAKYGLTGKGVVVVILDRGLQWQNPDFINPDGTTRIKHMLDMSGQNQCAPNGPTPIEYTEAQINAALAGTGPTIPERDALGHGTATTGMAAGNGRAFANGKYKGIAPEADLIIIKSNSEAVAAHDNEAAQAQFVGCRTQALQWLDQKLTALGKPAVALLNTGSQLPGPIDGTSIFSRTVDQYFSNHPGRVFVFASGDEGGIANHAGGTYNGTQNTVVTFNRTATAQKAMAVWYSGKAQITVTFSDGTTVGPLGPPPAPVNNQAASGDSTVIVRQYFPGSEPNLTTSNSGDHYVQLLISGHAGTTGNITIRGVSGTDTGKFDMYCDAEGVVTFTSNQVPGRMQELASTRSSIVAGAYVVRTNWVDINGAARTSTTQGALNALWTGSSDGPTRDGRIGVTLVAPGQNTMTSYATNSEWATFKFNEVQDGGGFYGLASATSGASPILTGAVALMLQMNPKLTSEQARNFLQQSARTDGFTGSVPNNQWGYGKLSILGALDLVSQCTFTLSSGGQAFTAQGGSGSITVTAPSGCPWSVEGLPAGITTNTKSGTGNGTINYQVAQNAGSAASSNFSIGTQTFTVEQGAASIPGLAAAGSFGHVASQGSWKFTLTAINLGASTAQARFSFLDEVGGALTMPFSFPQVPLSASLTADPGVSAAVTAASPLLASTLDRTLDPNAQVILESTGPDSAAALIGSGQLAANGNITGFGIFSNPTFHWDAVVPLETRNAAKYLLAFDNTGALATGIAAANIASQAAAIPVVIRDDTGAQIGTATINLPARGHISFMLNQQYPATSGKRGTIEFQTPAGGQISVLGLRANGGALTTLPVVANVGTGGGAIAHATYNGGFTSVFYLVNTGSASAQFTLSFFDESGNPLAVPLSLPQTGATPTTSALTQTLAAGAMLVVQTQAQDALASVLGSAQLTTTGNISGFEIFRWTTFGQEASVPLETRAPSSFVLVFDDTSGLTTGVAISNGAASPASITVNLRSDTGALLKTVSVNLAGHGHKSFLLPDLDAVTGGVRGMAEFVVPAGGKISVIGLRAKADGTLTTIPVLSK